MDKIDNNHITVKMFPGLIFWLENQKDPDGLINKLVADYRNINPVMEDRDPGFMAQSLYCRH